MALHIAERGYSVVHMETTYEYHSGPLHGELRRKHAPGRAPMYQDAAGAPVKTAKGDQHVRRGQSLYVLTYGSSGVIHYLWSATVPVTTSSRF